MSVTVKKNEELEELFGLAVDMAVEEWHDKGGLLADHLKVALKEVSSDFCVACTYKRKARTGAPFTGEPSELTPLSEIVHLPQRDGDDGNITRRMKHAEAVIDRLYRAGDVGQTDVELADRTGIYLDSCKGMRSSLLGHGWVKSSGRTRLSPRDRPMTVWVLTEQARILWEAR